MSNTKAIALKGHDLLLNSQLNKGTAFTAEERANLKLNGLLPPRIETLEEQAEQVYRRYSSIESNIEKSVYINDIHDTNQVLFYKVAADHLEEMLPIVYTPTIGEAVQKYSTLYKRPRGLYIPYTLKDNIEELLENYIGDRQYDIAVVSDSEGVLGIGDQGVGGLDICIGKLMVYTICAGIDPTKNVPIVLDVGTNNQELLNDPQYLGWRHPRVSEAEYDDFIKKFVDAFKKVMPKTFLHWEDFGRDNARKNLDIYRKELTSFNDDIQGTGAVALAAIMSAVKASGTPFNEHRIVIFGAGTAGAGIADQVYDAMLRSGVSEKDAKSKFYMIDRCGLLTDDMPDLLAFQRKYAQPKASVSNWTTCSNDMISLFDTVKNAKPTILIGCSTVTGAFNEPLIKEMYSNVKRPIIMPISNPTSKAEAHPKDLYKWTDGNALVATGSPFGKVEYNGKIINVSQCNNALAFPGIGLGIILANPKEVTENMLWRASKTLSEYPRDTDTSILPGFGKVKELSRKIAIDVAMQAVEDGVAEKQDFEEIVDSLIWTPEYPVFTAK